jgi:outer membrane protein insertion porin family
VKRIRSLFLPLVLFASFTAFPAPSSSLGKLASVKVTGNHELSSVDIATAAGLEIGQSLSEDDLKKAAERLGDTGMFSDLTYQYSTLPGKVYVQLTVTESTKLVTVRFDNFAWWTDDELLAHLHSQIPLFKGKLPLAGAMADTVADGLQALVTGHNLPGHVEYMQFAQKDKPIEALIYRIEATPIKIRSLEFPGALAEDLLQLQAAARMQLADKDYGRALVSTIASLDLRDICLRRGFLQAEFGTPVPVPVPDTAEPILIDVRVPVTPGPQFKVSAYSWSGNKAFPADVLEKLLTVRPGQPANPHQLEKDLSELRRLYGTRGYMRESAEIKPDLDSMNHTVAYAVTVVEGDQYRFGGLKIDGLEARAAARIGEKWLMREGDYYDSSYSKKLMPELASVLPPGVRWNILVHEDLNDKEKTVEVTIGFSPAVR